MSTSDSATPNGSAVDRGVVAAEEQALTGMLDLERQLMAQLDERKRRHAEETSVSDHLREDMKAAKPPGDVVSFRLGRLRDHFGSAIEAVQAPEPVRQQAQSFAAPVGAVVVPPFDYEWTWSSQINDGRIDSLAARKSDGAYDLASIATGETGDAILNLRAAVGIYVKPSTPGILRVSAAPSLSFTWRTLVNWQDGATAGFAGFLVQQFKISDNAFDGVVLRQIAPYLWGENSWLGGADGEGSSEAHPLAGSIAADGTHWYAVWVWCGTINEAGHDFGIFWWASARSWFSMKLPYIAWQLS